MIGTVFHWWVRQLASLLPGKWVSPRAANAKLAVAELLTPLGSHPARLVVALPARRGQAAARHVTAMTPDDLAMLRGAVTGRQRVRIRLQPGELLERELVLPIAAERAPAEVLALELDRLTPFPADQTLWGWDVIARDTVRGRIRLRLTVAPRTLLAPVLDWLQSAGLTPVLLEAPPGLEAPAGGATQGWRRLPLAVPGRPKRPAVMACALAGYAALAIAVVCVPFVRQSLALSQVEAQVDHIAPDLAEAATLRRHIALAGASLDAVSSARQSIGDALQAVATLTTALPDDTYLTDFTLHQRHLNMSGRSANAVRLIALLSADQVLRGAAFDAPVTRIENGKGDLFSIGVDLVP
jgi:general secretion pathway protein L